MYVHCFESEHTFPSAAAAKNEVIVGEQLHSSLRQQQQQHRHSCHQQQRGGPDGSDQASNVVLSESSVSTFVHVSLDLLGCP